MTGKMLALRPYQREAIDATVKAWRGGIARPAVVLPTGAGKTVVFAHLISEWLDVMRPYGRRALVLAHRTELCDQAFDKVKDVAPSLRVGMVKANRNETLADVIVGCVPTLASERRRRQLTNIGLIVIDECHHGTARSYVDIMESFGSFRDVGATPTLGVTATLVRGDGGALGDVWQSVAYERSIGEMIRDGYLVRPRGIRVKVADLDMKSVKVRGGDYSDGQLGEALENSMAPEAIAKACLKHAAEKQTLVFAPTVHSAELIAAELVLVGIPTAIVSGAMPAGERAKALQDFRDGKIRALCNCMVLTEGTDLPMAEVAVIARPTLNPGLYVQMVGRVLRLYPGKTDALVIDVVGVSQRHALTVPVELFGESAEEKLDDDGNLVDSDDEDERGNGGGVLDEILYQAGPLVDVEVDLFHGSGSAWMRTRAGVWFLPAGQRYIAIIPAPVPGHWDVVAMDKQQVGVSRWVTRDVADLSYAMSWAEGDVTPYEEMTARKDRGWRVKKPTAPQVKHATNLGIDVSVFATSGEVSRAITEVLASRRMDPLLPAYAHGLVSA